jgi:hypothetical protein
MTRNLVLLLTSGHTVRIALEDIDLDDGDLTIEAAGEFVSSRVAVAVNPFELNITKNEFGGIVDLRMAKGDVVFAFVENVLLPDLDKGPDDYQRITVEGPGTVVQY